MAEPTPNIAELMKRAPDLRAKLNQASDQLNETITAFETALSNLKLGVAGEVRLEQEEDGSYVDLVYRRIGASWGLYIEEDGPHQEFDITDLKKVSRARRVEAVNRFDKLLENVFTNLVVEFREVQSSIEKGRALTAGLAELAETKAGKK